MRRFATLLGFELKKIARGRGTLASLALCAALLFGLTMLQYLDVRSDGRYARAMAGRRVDDGFVAEVAEAAARAGGLAAVPPDSPYYHAARWMDRMLGSSMSIPGVSRSLPPDRLTAGALYAARDGIMDDLYGYFRLREDEKAWWTARECRVDRPYTWVDSRAAAGMKANFRAVTALLCLLAGVCLAGTYADERRRRTDAMVLCARHGRRMLWRVKLCAGELWALVAGMTLLAAAQLPHILSNGLRGLDGAWQLVVPFSAYPHDIGTMLLVYLGLYGLICLLMGAMVMALSAWLQNAIAVTGVVGALVMADLFISVPPRLRALSQLRYLTPVQIMVNSAMADPRLVVLFGRFMTPLQTAALVYPLATLGLFWLAGKGYGRMR